MKYANLKDYTNALDQDLERTSQGNEILLAELRKDVALERLVSRFDPQTFRQL